MMRWIILLILIPTALSACYTIEQAYHFNNSFNSRVRVDGALAAKELNPELRHKLELSRSVLEFAKQQGLNTGNAYQHFIPELSSHVSYLVQAAPVDKLEPVTWWFPFVGSVPYLGYFERERRDAKAKALRQQGYDVSLGSVGAFSSLGWFDDPIYASMTRRSDEEFVQIILHELVHRSYWSKGSVPFNENLAEFIGHKLTEQYLTLYRAGAGIEELKAIHKERNLLKAWLDEFKLELQVLYARTDIDRLQKLEYKKKVIDRFQNEELARLDLTIYSHWKNREWNNSSLIGASLYSPDFSSFEGAASCLGQFHAGSFLSALKKAESRFDSAAEALKNLCQPSPSAGIIGH